jgi:hypothetical protein
MLPDALDRARSALDTFVARNEATRGVDVTRWERMQLDMPDDFPVDALESLHHYLSDRREGQPQSESWKEWSTGLNGLVFRFLACHEAAASVVHSLETDNTPPMPERYHQERDLFAFFFQGLSALESVIYGIYFVASLSDPIRFPTTIDRKTVVPGLVKDRFRTHVSFGSDRISAVIDAVVSSPDYKEWAKIRNFLGHRGAPGRTIYEGGAAAGRVDWNLPIQQVNVPTILQPTEIQRRRDWLGTQVTDISQSAEEFAFARVP